MSADEEEFGPDLIIEQGDCEFWGRCAACRKVLGIIRPDQSFDVLGMAWERHVMGGKCPA